MSYNTVYGRNSNPGNVPLLDEAGRAALRRVLEEETPPRWWAVEWAEGG